jgi:hypothetical protein
MKTPPSHLAHLYQAGGPNRAPIIDLHGTAPRIPFHGPRVLPPIPPPIRKGSGPLYSPPPASPPGIINR